MADVDYQSGALFLLSLALCLYSNIRRENERAQSRVYYGSCHCRRIEFEVEAPNHLVLWDCNCSICYMKKNTHFVVALNKFRLLKGDDSIIEYKFNTGVARHTFCKFCGVQAFYFPRSNPDGVAITFACIKESQVNSYEIRQYDGKNWESYHKQSGISKFSSS